MRSTPPFERFSVYAPFRDAHLAEHVYSDHETLAGIAHRYYGDWRRWTLIAERNDIVDARRIEPGTVLLIPGRTLAVSEEEALESL